MSRIRAFWVISALRLCCNYALLSRIRFCRQYALISVCFVQTFTQTLRILLRFCADICPKNWPLGPLVYQVEVIWEAHIDWWKALITWLRSLGGLKGICDILQCLHDFINSPIHLLHCSPSSRTFLANQLALLNEQDVAKPTNWASSPRLSWWSSWSSSTLPSSFPSPPTASLALAQRWRRLFQWQGCWPSPPRLRSDCYQQNWR